MRYVALHVLIVSLFLVFSKTDAPPPAPVEPPPAPVHYTLEPPPAPTVAVAEARSPGTWGETIDRGAFGNRTKITVREHPRSNAAAVVTLTGDDARWANFDLVDSDGSWLHIRGVRDGARYDGWVVWNDAVPYAFALVLDTGTGAVVARLPLATEMTGISFSPDGTHAVIGTRSGRPHGGNGLEAKFIYEVRTSDFTLTRMIRIPADATDLAFAGAFYDRDDGTLRVILIEGMVDFVTGGTLELASVDGMGRLIDPVVVDSGVSAVVVSPNERTAIAVYAGEYTAKQHRYGVVDLPRSTVHNTFTVDMEDDWWMPYDMVLNTEGSEMYGLAGEDLVAIDTSTGKLARKVAIPTRDSTSLIASTQNFVNSSLLVSAYDYDNETETAARAPGYWVRGGSILRADRRLDLVC